MPALGTDPLGLSLPRFAAGGTVSGRSAGAASPGRAGPLTTPRAGRGGWAQVAAGVHAMVVPGSGLVKMEAEEEGLHEVLIEAGFDWREPG